MTTSRAEIDDEIEALEAQVAQLKDRDRAVTELLLAAEEKLRQKTEALCEELKAARATLEFYSEGSHYDVGTNWTETGGRALYALARIDKFMKGLL